MTWVSGKHLTVFNKIHIKEDELWLSYFMQVVKTLLCNIIQLLTGDEGNIWYVGPEDKMLLEAEGRGQHFVWRSNISYVARITSH